MENTKKRENDVLTVEIKLDKAEYTEFENKAYIADKAKYNVDGYRKGHAPKEIIERRYGKGLFLETAVNMVLKQYRMEILTPEEMRDVIDESIDLKEFNDDGIIIEWTLQMYPEVKLGDYKGLEFEKTKVEVTEEDINNELKQYQEQGMRLVNITDRPVKNGDSVVIDFEGKLNGVPFEGGTAKLYTLEIGSGTFIPGFEDQVIGMNIDETKDINVTFPADYHAEELKGKPVVFTVVLHEIKEKQYPEINDELAANCSEFESLAELKADIEKNIRVTREKHAESELEDMIINKITDTSTFNVPEMFVERQAEFDLNNFEERLRSQYPGITLDIYCKYFGITKEKIMEDIKENARNTVRTQLVIEKLIEAEKIVCTDAELEETVSETAKNVGKEVKDYIAELPNETLARYKNRVVIEKLFKMLKEENTIK